MDVYPKKWSVVHPRSGFFHEQSVMNRALEPKASTLFQREDQESSDKTSPQPPVKRENRENTGEPRTQRGCELNKLRGRCELQERDETQPSETNT